MRGYLRGQAQSQFRRILDRPGYPKRQVRHHKSANRESTHTCHLRHCGLKDGRPLRAPSASVKTNSRFPCRFGQAQCGNSFEGYVTKGKRSNTRFTGAGTEKKSRIRCGSLPLSGSWSGILRPWLSEVIGRENGRT
jgi:hypothetical protein